MANSYIEISGMDNVNGISNYIPDKIFQPLITTKPTGKGTGLGLSLSYYIVKQMAEKLMLKLKKD